MKIKLTNPNYGLTLPYLTRKITSPSLCSYEGGETRYVPLLESGSVYDKTTDKLFAVPSSMKVGVAFDNKKYYVAGNESDKHFQLKMSLVWGSSGITSITATPNKEAPFDIYIGVGDSYRPVFINDPVYTTYTPSFLYISKGSKTSVTKEFTGSSVNMFFSYYMMFTEPTYNSSYPSSKIQVFHKGNPGDHNKTIVVEDVCGSLLLPGYNGYGTYFWTISPSYLDTTSRTITLNTTPESSYNSWSHSFTVSSTSGVQTYYLGPIGWTTSTNYTAVVSGASEDITGNTNTSQSTKTITQAFVVPFGTRILGE